MFCFKCQPFYRYLIFSHSPHQIFLCYGTKSQSPLSGSCFGNKYKNLLFGRVKKKKKLKLWSMSRETQISTLNSHYFISINNCRSRPIGRWVPNRHYHLHHHWSKVQALQKEPNTWLRKHDFGNVEGGTPFWNKVCFPNFPSHIHTNAPKEKPGSTYSKLNHLVWQWWSW